MTDQDKLIAAIEDQLRRDADTIALHHLRRLIYQDGRDDLCFHFEDLTCRLYAPAPDTRYFAAAFDAC
jgi:hypothetical protein